MTIGLLGIAALYLCVGVVASILIAIDTWRRHKSSILEEARKHPRSIFRGFGFCAISIAVCALLWPVICIGAIVDWSASR